MSAHRPLSWCRELSEQGFDVTVITRNWTGEEGSTFDGLTSESGGSPWMEQKTYGDVHFLPYKNTWMHKCVKYLQGRSAGYSMLRRLIELFGLFTGNFTNEVNVHYAFKGYIDRLFLVKKYDLVLVTAHPISIIRLGYYLTIKHKAKLVVDFRDHWNNNLLNKSFNFSWGARIYFLIQECWLRRWLSKCNLLLAASESILEDCHRLTGVTGKTIHNGYEQGLFNDVSCPEICKQKFCLSVIGVLYPTQDLNLLLCGLKAFYAATSRSEDILFCFIGQGYFPSVASEISRALDKKALLITDRLPRRRALGFMHYSQVLLYSGWLGWRGIYSGKVFEYLAARRPIVLLPGDRDVLDRLMKETESGKATYSVDEFVDVMLLYYDQWRSSGVVKISSNMSVIKKYDRSVLAKKLVSYLREVLGD